MKHLTAYGQITAGKLTISWRDRLMKSLACWPDGRVSIRIERVYRKRSLPANAYYWGVVINEFCDGYTEMTGEKIEATEAHEFLKTRFNSKQVVNKRTGEIANVPQKTSTLTTVQFMEYQQECVRFIAEFFGRSVPEPNEQTEIFN